MKSNEGCGAEHLYERGVMRTGLRMNGDPNRTCVARDDISCRRVLVVEQNC